MEDNKNLLSIYFKFKKNKNIQEIGKSSFSKNSNTDTNDLSNSSNIKIDQQNKDILKKNNIIKKGVSEKVFPSKSCFEKKKNINNYEECSQKMKNIQNLQNLYYSKKHFSNKLLYQPISNDNSKILGPINVNNIKRFNSNNNLMDVRSLNNYRVHSNIFKNINNFTNNDYLNLKKSFSQNDFPSERNKFKNKQILFKEHLTKNKNQLYNYKHKLELSLDSKNRKKYLTNDDYYCGGRSNDKKRQFFDSPTSFNEIFSNKYKSLDYQKKEEFLSLILNFDLDESLEKSMRYENERVKNHLGNLRARCEGKKPNKSKISINSENSFKSNLSIKTNNIIGTYRKKKNIFILDNHQDMNSQFEEYNNVNYFQMLNNNKNGNLYKETFDLKKNIKNEPIILNGLNNSILQSHKSLVCNNYAQILNKNMINNNNITFANQDLNMNFKNNKNYVYQNIGKNIVEKFDDNRFPEKKILDAQSKDSNKKLLLNGNQNNISNFLMINEEIESQKVDERETKKEKNENNPQTMSNINNHDVVKEKSHLNIDNSDTYLNNDISLKLVDSFSNSNKLIKQNSNEIKLIESQKYKNCNSLKKLRVYDSLSEDEAIEKSKKFYIIKPESKLKLFLEFCNLIICFYSLTALPLNLIFSEYYDLKYIIFEIIFDIILIIDFLCGFFLAFVDLEENEINEIKFTVLNYIRTYFIIDLIAAIPFNSILEINKLREIQCLDIFYDSVMINKGNSINLFNFWNSAKLNSYMNKNHFNFWNLNIFHDPFFTELQSYNQDKPSNLLKLFRIIKVIKVANGNLFMNFFKKKYSLEIIFDSYFMYLLFVLLAFISIVHILSCCFIYLGTLSELNAVNWWHMENAPFFDIYIMSAYFNLATIFTIGYGDIITRNIYEREYDIVLMIFGIMLYSFAVTYISNKITENDKMNKFFDSKRDFLYHLSIKYNLSSELMDKLNRHVLHGAKSTIIDLNPLFADLSIVLRNEIILNMHKNSVNQFTFLRNVTDNEFIIKVIMSLIPSKSAKNDILINQGEYFEEVIFIKSGKIVLEAIVNVEEGITRFNNKPFQNIKQTNKRSNKKNSLSWSKHNLEIKENKLKNFQKVMIAFISDHEHFGDSLLYENLQSPVTLKIKSKTAETLLMSKIDLVKLSIDFPDIFQKIYRKSKHNVKSCLDFIQRSKKIYIMKKRLAIKEEMYYANKLNSNNASKIENLQDKKFSEKKEIFKKHNENNFDSNLDVKEDKIIVELNNKNTLANKFQDFENFLISRTEDNKLLNDASTINIQNICPNQSLNFFINNSKLEEDLSINLNNERNSNNLHLYKNGKINIEMENFNIKGKKKSFIPDPIFLNSDCDKFISSNCLALPNNNESFKNKIIHQDKKLKEIPLFVSEKGNFINEKETDSNSLSKNETINKSQNDYLVNSSNKNEIYHLEKDKEINRNLFSSERSNEYKSEKDKSNNLKESLISLRNAEIEENNKIENSFSISKGNKNNNKINDYINLTKRSNISTNRLENLISNRSNFVLLEEISSPEKKLCSKNDFKPNIPENKQIISINETGKNYKNPISDKKLLKSITLNKNKYNHINTEEDANSTREMNKICIFNDKIEEELIKNTEKKDKLKIKRKFTFKKSEDYNCDSNPYNFNDTEKSEYNHDVNKLNLKPKFEMLKNKQSLIDEFPKEAENYFDYENSINSINDNLSKNSKTKKFVKKRYLKNLNKFKKFEKNDNYVCKICRNLISSEDLDYENKNVLLQKTLINQDKCFKNISMQTTENLFISGFSTCNTSPEKKIISPNKIKKADISKEIKNQKMNSIYIEKEDLEKDLDHNLKSTLDDPILDSLNYKGKNKLKKYSVLLENNFQSNLNNLLYENTISNNNEGQKPNNKIVKGDQIQEDFNFFGKLEQEMKEFTNKQKKEINYDKNNSIESKKSIKYKQSYQIKQSPEKKKIKKSTRVGEINDNKISNFLGLENENNQKLIENNFVNLNNGLPKKKLKSKKEYHQLNENLDKTNIPIIYDFSINNRQKALESRDFKIQSNTRELKNFQYHNNKVENINGYYTNSHEKKYLSKDRQKFSVSDSSTILRLNNIFQYINKGSIN